MPARTTEAWQPRRGDTELWLEGVASGLSPGDAILIVGLERQRDPGSERWDVRVLSAVEPTLPAAAPACSGRIRSAAPSRR